MSRLSEKLATAAGVVKRTTDDIEERADLVIAREAKIKQRGSDIFGEHNAVLDEAEKGLDAVERALAQMSNAPLPASGSSPPPLPQAGSTASSDTGH